MVGLTDHHPGMGITELLCLKKQEGERAQGVPLTVPLSEFRSLASACSFIPKDSIKSTTGCDYSISGD